MSTLNDCVLVVEDEFFIADQYVYEIEKMGLAVCGVASTAQQAIAIACEHRPRLVLMDVRLKGAEDGVDAAQGIHRAVGSKVIFITGSQEPATLRRIELAHGAAMLSKPVYGNKLRMTVESVLGIATP
jgi:CheY-like chemotaxis protein